MDEDDALDTAFQEARSAPPGAWCIRAEVVEPEDPPSHDLGATRQRKADCHHLLLALRMEKAATHQQTANRAIDRAEVYRVRLGAATRAEAETIARSTLGLTGPRIRRPGPFSAEVRRSFDDLMSAFEDQLNMSGLVDRASQPTTTPRALDTIWRPIPYLPTIR